MAPKRFTCALLLIAAMLVFAIGRPDAATSRKKTPARPSTTRKRTSGRSATASSSKKAAAAKKAPAKAPSKSTARKAGSKTAAKPSSKAKKPSGTASKPAAKTAAKTPVSSETLAAWRGRLEGFSSQTLRLLAREEALRKRIAEKQKALESVTSETRAIRDGEKEFLKQEVAKAVGLAEQNEAERAIAKQLNPLAEAISDAALAFAVQKSTSGRRRQALALHFMMDEAAAPLRELTQLNQKIERDRREHAAIENALEQNEAKRRREAAAGAQLAADLQALREELRDTATRRGAIEKEIAALEAKLAEAHVETHAATRVKAEPTTVVLASVTSPRPQAPDEPTSPAPAPSYTHLRDGDVLDIWMNAGSEVHTVEMGTVVFAGYFGGYGNVVIVEHPDGVCSLYGYLSEVLIAPGDRILRGQVIGRSGLLRGRGRAGLRFELRVVSEGREEPIDPASWLPEGVNLEERLRRGIE